MCLVEQRLQFIQFLVCLWVPLVAEQYHLDNLVAVLLQVLFQGTLEVGGLYPGHIVLLRQQFIIFSSLLHIDLHVCRYLYQTVTCLTVFILIVISEDVVDVLIFYPLLRQVVFVAYRQRQFVVDGIDKDRIAQDVAIKRQQKRKATTVYTLEEGALAESHHTLTCTTQILQQMFVSGGGIGRLCGILILGESVAGQAQFLHHRNHLF